MLDLHPRVLVSLCLPALLSAGCDQVRSLKASNSEERFGRNQRDDDEPGQHTPPPYFPPGNGDGDDDNYSPWPDRECWGTEVLCDSWCVDVLSSLSHCGDCNQACGSLQRCNEGSCECAVAGHVMCNAQCVTATLGPCGECGDACPVDTGACQDDDSHVADWPTLGGSSLRSGYNAGEQGVPPLDDDWAVSVHPTALQPAMISGTKVYVSARSAFEKRAPLFALDIVTGQVLWEKDFGEVTSVGQPTLDGCRVYVQHASGPSIGSHLWALDSQTGDEIWARLVPTQRNLFWSPAVTDEAVYLAAGTNGGLSAYARSDASTLFEVDTTANFDSWAPAVYAGDVYTFVDGRLRRHDALTGETKDAIHVTWQFSGYSVNTLPAFSADGTVYLVAPPTVYAFDAHIKQLKWQGGTAALGAPALAEGLLLVRENRTLSAFDALSGEKAWTASETDNLLYGPVAANGFAYVASGATTYAIEVKTGAVVSQKTGGGHLSIGGGRLLVAGVEGLLRSYKLSTTPPPAP